MKRIIWSCWFQGRDNAPHIARKCLDSWEQTNPDWEFRCLDAYTIKRYISLPDGIDLKEQQIAAASLSDIVRLLLLHEYGGVWADATLFCNRPLDSWLPDRLETGFFAFEKPGVDRPLSSWFLACDPGHLLIDRWLASALSYWKNRQRSDDYFWLHHLFGEMCATDERAGQAWDAVPKVSAVPPHVIQHGGAMYKPTSEVKDSIDWTIPLFKLTYRINRQKLNPGCLLYHVLQCDHLDDEPEPIVQKPSHTEPHKFASLSLKTENLGDHLQIIASRNLLARLDIEPSLEIDRDDEIRSAPSLRGQTRPVAMLVNGWFKTNRTEWPPHPDIVPVFLGFHIRLFQCPELLSDDAVTYYKKYEPIGCRDSYTESLLRSKGVDAYVSNCLTLLFSRRIQDPLLQTETFVVSRDERLLKMLPETLGPVTPICHYSGSNDFQANMAEAQRLLEIYRMRAKLIITTLLHCALPAIATGIPTIVFYPANSEAGHTSDRERFSSLEKIIQIFHFDEMHLVDWHGQTFDISETKLSLLESFFEQASRWQLPPQREIGPMAPSSVLPSP